MTQQKSVLTNKKLEEIYDLLCKTSENSECSETGRSIYSFMFYGTKEEAEAIQQKLIKLKPLN